MSFAKIAFRLDDCQALALAQFVKRVGWREWRDNAADDFEAQLMRAAFLELEKALKHAGYNPR